MTQDNGINTRAIILDAILEITENKEYSHRILDFINQKYAYLDKKDRAFISRVVHGSLEYLLQIDFIIEKYSSIKLKKIKPTILAILRMSIYQILYMDRVPDSAVCNEAVKLTAKRGFHGLKPYVNAVLRKVSKDKTDIEFKDKSIYYSTPSWIIDIFLEQFGETYTDSILEALLNNNYLSVRVNKSKADIEAIIDEFQALDIKVEKSEILDELLYISGFDSLNRIGAVLDGRVNIQDFGSAMVAKLADIKENDFIIDVCAAPGGKSLHAADLLNNTGKVMAFDISQKKVDLLNENIEKSGFENIEAKISDALLKDSSLIEKADIVIADLPCSGLGIIGRKPDIKLNMSKEACFELAKLQEKILDNIKDYVKPGGKLIFSTCTINKYENEENRRIFLENNKNFSPISIEKYFKNSDTAMDGYIQILPNEYKSDGFFISVYRKNK